MRPPLSGATRARATPFRPLVLAALGLASCAESAAPDRPGPEPVLREIIGSPADPGWSGPTPADREAVEIRLALARRGRAVHPGDATPLAQALARFAAAGAPDDDAPETAELAAALAATGLTTDVRFEPSTNGAVIQYRSLGPGPERASGLAAAGTTVTLPAGLYSVWETREDERDAPRRRVALLGASEVVRARLGK